MSKLNLSEASILSWVRYWISSRGTLFWLFFHQELARRIFEEVDPSSSLLFLNYTFCECILAVAQASSFLIWSSLKCLFCATYPLQLPCFPLKVQFEYPRKFHQVLSWWFFCSSFWTWCQVLQVWQEVSFCLFRIHVYQLELPQGWRQTTSKDLDESLTIFPQSFWVLVIWCRRRVEVVFWAIDSIYWTFHWHWFLFPLTIHRFICTFWSWRGDWGFCRCEPKTNLIPSWFPPSKFCSTCSWSR